MRRGASNRPWHWAIDSTGSAVNPFAAAVRNGARALPRALVSLVGLTMIVNPRASAQEEPSRLRYTAPKSWTLDTDGETLLPAGNRDNAVVVFSPSRTFAGTAEQWATEKWNRIARDGKVMSGPQPGTQGIFLTRTGAFEKADGTRFWIVLHTLVQDGRGEAVIFLATNEALFRQHLPALGQLLQGATIASSPKPAAANPGAGADMAVTPAAAAPEAPVRIPGGAEVVGLYTVMRQYYAYQVSGAPGSGQYTYGTAYYLFSADGRVFRSVNLEEGTEEHDIRLFDFDAARRRSPNDYGTYAVSGNEVILTMEKETIVATRPGPNAIKVNEQTYTRTTLTSPRTEVPGGFTGGLKTPPKALPVPAASIPNTLKGLPTLSYLKPPGFTQRSGIGVHEARPCWQARIEVYDFRPFDGNNFEQEVRATRLRDWLAAESRENPLVGEAEFELGTADGADQVVTTVFAEQFEGPRMGTGDQRAPRLRTRTAILASGAVAIVEMMIRDRDAWQEHQKRINAFAESMKILPAPPSMTRDEILAIAGQWQKAGTHLSATGKMLDSRAGMDWYIFSLDGRVAWGGNPVEDFRAFDFGDVAKTGGVNVGTYFKRGDQLVMRFGPPPYSVYYANITGLNELEILGYTYHRTQRAEVGKP